MTDDQIKDLIHMNQRQSLLLGYMTSFLFEYGKTLEVGSDSEIKYKWMLSALDNLFYLDKPFPPMP